MPPYEALLIELSVRSNPEGRKSVAAASAGRAEASFEEPSAPPPDMEGMTAAEAAAQDELLKLAAELENIRRKALTLSESLTPPNECSTEMRTVISCVVHDMIEPAIRSLQGGTEYQPTLHQPGSGASGILIDEK